MIRRVAIAIVLSIAVRVIVAAQAAPVRASRVISLIPATTEMLFAMGAGSRLVAAGSYDHYPPEVERLPKVGALLDPNIERILTLKPDLVVVYGTQTELKNRLDRAHIPYYTYVHKGLPDISDTIRSLGARVGVAPQANALARSIDSEVTKIRNDVARLPRPKTLLVFGRERGSLRNIDASGGVGFLHDMLEAAGGTNVLTDVGRQSLMLTTEMVLARAPEVILELRYGPPAAGDAEDLRQWNTLAAVPAVKSKRIHQLRGEQFVVPGPRVVQAVEQMARTLHPEAFK
jgi:iron complex transport system substrate-binding protein